MGSWSSKYSAHHIYILNPMVVEFQLLMATRTWSLSWRCFHLDSWCQIHFNDTVNITLKLAIKYYSVYTNVSCFVVSYSKNSWPFILWKWNLDWWNRSEFYSLLGQNATGRLRVPNTSTAQLKTCKSIMLVNFQFMGCALGLVCW